MNNQNKQQDNQKAEETRLFCLQNKLYICGMAGRPAHFENEEELVNSINEYFKYIEGEFELKQGHDEEGNPIEYKSYTRPPENATITGLALYLGFESRQSIYDYEKSGTFSYTIKRARLHVENAYEKALLSKNATGAIFALKNFGWSDKLDVTSDGEKLKSQVTIFQLPDNGR